MADILIDRYTRIMVGNSGDPPLYPSDTLFPSDDLYPRSSELVELVNIVAGSMVLEEMLVDKEPVWGLFFASRFEVKVFNTEEDLSGKYIHVYQEDRGMTRSVFTGYIDSCKKDKITDDRTIIAYDPAYYWGSTDVSGWWDTFWQANPDGATLHDLRMNLLGTFGFPSEDVILPNDDLIVNMNIHLASGSFAAIMKMLCELSCSYPHFNRDGMLEFLLFNTDAEPIDLTDKYEWNASDFEEYQTIGITGIQFFDSGDQLKRTIGSANNAYGIYQNVFTYNLSTEQLDHVGQIMLDYLQDFTFTPSNIKMIMGDFDLNVGDYVKTEFGNFYIFKNSYSGSQLIEQTISAEGSMELNSTAQPIDFKSVVLTENIARVEQNVENFYIEYSNTVQGISSRITQTYDELSFKVDSQTTSAYIITKINQNGNDGKIVSSVEIGADVIDINGIVRLLEAEEIRTVLNGETGEGEPAKFIKYTGNNIQFYEGSYDDNSLKAALSYDGLDYYRNDSMIGRYTTNAYMEFAVTNIYRAYSSSATYAGITRSYVSAYRFKLNGTTNIGSNSYVRMPINSASFIGTSGHRYRLTYTVISGTLPDMDGVQLIAISNGLPSNPYAIGNLSPANDGVFFTVGPFSQNISCTLYLNIYKSGIPFNNVTLEFKLYDLTEEQQLQYGLDIQLREGSHWDVAVWNSSTKTNSIKLLYAKEDLYTNKNHTTKAFEEGSFYALTPWEFREKVSLRNLLYTNGYKIQCNSNIAMGLYAGSLVRVGNITGTIYAFEVNNSNMGMNYNGTLKFYYNYNNDKICNYAPYVLAQPIYTNGQNIYYNENHTDFRIAVFTDSIRIQDISQTGLMVHDDYIALLHNNNRVFTYERNNSRLYTGAPLYLGRVMYTNGYDIRYSDSYDTRVTINSTNVNLYTSNTRVTMNNSNVSIYTSGGEVFDASSNKLWLGYSSSIDTEISNTSSTLNLNPGTLQINGKAGFTGNVITDVELQYLNNVYYGTALPVWLIDDLTLRGDGTVSNIHWVHANDSDSDNWFDRRSVVKSVSTSFDKVRKGIVIE